MEPCRRVSGRSSQGSSEPAAASAIALLAEQLKQASRAFDACLVRHAAERKQCEAQVSSLLAQLQAMSAEIVFAKDYANELAACPIQPPPAARMGSFLAAAAGGRPSLQLQMGSPQSDLPKEALPPVVAAGTPRVADAQAERRPSALRLQLGSPRSEPQPVAAASTPCTTDVQAERRPSALQLQLGSPRSDLPKEALPQPVAAAGTPRVADAQAERRPSAMQLQLGSPRSEPPREAPLQSVAAAWTPRTADAEAEGRPPAVQLQLGSPRSELPKEALPQAVVAAWTSCSSDAEAEGRMLALQQAEGRPSVRQQADGRPPVLQQAEGRPSVRQQAEGRPSVVQLQLGVLRSELPKEALLQPVATAWTPRTTVVEENAALADVPLKPVAFVSEKEESDLGSQIGIATKVVRQRLLMRLGRLDANSLIKGRDLHQACSALGLERYSLAEMDAMVHKLAEVVNLQFRPIPPRPRIVSQLSQLSQFQQHMSMTISTRRASLSSMPQQMSSSTSRMAEQAEWCWPEVAPHSDWGWTEALGVSHDPAHWHRSKTSNKVAEVDVSHGIPLKVLIKAMTVDDVTLKKLLGSNLCEQLFAMKEVLVTGDANRLVAELTCVRIDDLTTRAPESDWYIFEPFVGVLVVANGIAVGFQTESAFADWHGWLAVEVAFTVAFFLELLVRHAWYRGKAFWCGPDRHWNLLDVFLLAVGIAEVCLSVADKPDRASLSIVRVVRLLKLIRLVRIFRLKVTRELQLMVKGLLGGLRTLCWAFVLLLSLLYVLGLIAYTALSNDWDETVQELLEDVPAAMFTVFRCVTGDCFTRAGTSLTAIMVGRYGVPFACCYFVAYLTIALGVFNVILAIYVETTMTAAKQTEGRQERESIRIAHLTKRLLKLFCAAEETFNRQMGDGMPPTLDMKKLIMATDLNNTDVKENTCISKELFLLVIQEPAVQKMMDELDIPPDRATLFDCIDADASGSVDATELVLGLLKVRGEVKKSDQVACLLALRAIQATLLQMDGALKSSNEMPEHSSFNRSPR